MLEQIKEIAPTSFAMPAKEISLKDIPPELICFALQQMALFYRKCDRLSLSVINPIAFLDAIRQQLRLNREQSLLMRNAADYLPLMLLFSAYGNSLFCAGERPASRWYASSAL